MASHQGKLKQYLLILEYLKGHPESKYQAVQDYLSAEGFVISKRTFQRNLEALRDEFGVEVVCDTSEYTYRIDEALSMDLEVLIHFLTVALQTDFVLESIKDFKTSSTYLHFAEKNDLQGLTLLPRLSSAIKQKLQLSFKHYSYAHQIATAYTVEPHLLCEYHHRWYLVAYVPERAQFRTFGVDRIQGLNVSAQSFQPQAEDPKQFFDYLIGINYSGLTPHIETVQIKASTKQSQYLRSKPLHPTQQELEEGYFEYELILNKELIKRLLMMGAQIEVLAPTTLRQAIKEEIKQMTELYNNE